MFTRNRRRRLYCVFALLTLCAAFPSTPAKAVGTWADGPSNPWDNISTMNLLPNGSILVGGYANGAYNGWYLYTPDAQGNYTDGTWTQLQPSTWASLYNVSWILNDGRYWTASGEYPGDPDNTSDTDPHNHAQYYNPLTNTWTQLPDGPNGYIGDTGAAMLADGRLLVSNDMSSAVDFFDPTTNVWAPAASLPVGSGDEQNWQLLADGSVMEAYTNPGYRYLPQNDVWLPIANTPISMTTDLYGDEEGPVTYLPNGLVYAASDHGPVEQFTPPATLGGTGAWQALNPYPTISNEPSNGADCPVSIEPDGKMLMVVSQYQTPTATAGPEFGPAAFYEYDPSTDTYTSITDPLGYNTAGFTCRFLNLPNGQIMMTGGQNDIHFYTPDLPALTAAAPTISGVSSNGDGSYTLTGTQLSGLWYGSVYGDDEYMATNFPIVTLTDGSGNVYFCRAYNLSSNGLATGSTAETVTFMPPANLPNESFTLGVSVNGIPSSTTLQFPIQAFTLTASNDVSIGTGAPGQTTITVTPNNGFSGAVALTVTGLPTGVTAQLANPTTTSTDVITFSAQASAPVGTTKVTVVGAFGNVAESVTFNLTIGSSSPLAPGNVSAQGLDQAVQLSWSQALGASTYNIYRGATAGGEGSTAIATGVVGTKYVDTGITAGTQYFYQVAGVNSIGVGAKSSEVSATPVAQAPDAPTGLTATATNGQISLTWNASTLATSYTVSYSTSSGGEASGTQISGITGTSTTVTGLTLGTTYYFVVEGVDTDGASSASNEASATEAPVPPVSPAGVNATQGDTQVTVGWIPVDAATSYNVYMGTASGAESTTPVLTDITGSTATVTGLTDGTTYYFTVTAVNAGGVSSTSNEAIAIPEPPAPAAPVLTGTGGFEQANLSWTAPSGATFYDVYESTSPTGTFNPIAQQISSTTYTVPNLPDNTTFYFQVDAGNVAGVSAASNVVAVTPQFAAPTNLTATPGEASVALSWTATPGASSYNIYMSTTAGGEGTTPVQGNVRGTSYTVTGLTDGTTYYFKVAGTHQSLISIFSNEASATPALVTPPAPTGLVAVPGDTEVVLTWNSGTPGVTFNVYQGTTSGGESATPVQTGITSGATVVTGLTDGTTYYFTVAAVNGAGTGPASSEVSSTPETPAPSAPVLSATTSDQTVDLSWTAAANASSYNVYMGSSSGGEDATPIATDVTSTTFAKTGLQNGNTYYFIVRGVNGVGTGPSSNEISAIPSIPPPPAPTLTATAGNKQVSLSWNSVSGATGYNVYAGTSAGGESATPVASGLAGTTYVDTSVTNDTKYYFVVRAVGAGGAGSASNEVSATPAPPPPGAVTNLTAGSGDKQVVLTWTGSTAATSYNIYASTTSGGEADPPATTTTTSTTSSTGVVTVSGTVTGLSNGVKYFFTVKAVNDGGTSPQSTEVSAIPVAALQLRSGINFFSVTSDYSSMTIDAALGGSGIQVATWSPNLDSYAVTPTAPADHLRLGVGYWGSFTSAMSTAPGGTAADPSQDFTINLQTGWNSIGDPFTVAVPLSNLTFANGTETFAQATSGNNAIVFGSMYSYNQSSNSYEVAQSLEPGSGYWVYAFSNTTMTVPHP